MSDPNYQGANGSNMGQERIRELRDREATTRGVGAAIAEEYMAERIQRIRDRFAYHHPKPDQVQRFAVLRQDFQNLAERILTLTHEGPFQDMALDALSEAMMKTNRAIALE